MRKAYIEPRTEIISIVEECALMAASGDNLIQIDPNYTITDDSGAGSKGHHFDLWADDEE